MIDALLDFLFETWFGRVLFALVVAVATVVLVTFGLHGIGRLVVWAWRLS